MATRNALTFVLYFGLVLAGASAPASSSSFSTAPSTNTNCDTKWRLGYYEGGPYEEYYDRLAATVRGLMELGWIESVDLPNPEKKDSRQLWDWLRHNARSEYVQFPEENFVSAGWDRERQLELKDRVIERLRDSDDFDLILAMGTRAGQDLANDMHSVPTVVITSTDPVRSGIIASTDDSGLDHLHARVDPLRDERQLEIFHRMIGFRKLGLAYEDSPAGHNHAAVETLRAIGERIDFEIVECHTVSDIPDLELAGQSVIDCFNELVHTSDAIYVTIQGGVNRETIPKLVEIANRNRVPTLSQIGEKGVRAGFLVSVSSAYTSKKSGRFFASVVAKILNGATPRQLEQILEESPSIALNLETAEIVGLYLQADILAAADEVFPKIEVPE